MSVLLYILSIALGGSFAASTPISSDHLYQRLLSSNSSSSSSSEFGQRSTWDIVWGCLTTIFACSWVSVHPNIPLPDAKWWRIALIRFELMVWTILAPEIIILAAAKQWLAARQLKNTYKENGWTITHGFFIQMGGFMLFDGGVRKGVISPRRFDNLIKTKQIAFPEITVEEIKDRSKGDSLSKGLVLVQVAWFITQFLARLSEGLNVTQLELTTFALAAMNGFMYLFWWNKPLDIHLPIPIRLLRPPESIGHSANSSSSEAGTEPLLAEPEYPPQAAIPSAEHISNTNGFFHQRNSWRHVIRKAWRSRFSVAAEIEDPQLLDTMSVPIFFSSVDRVHDKSVGNVIAAVVGTVFGAIHCVGWNLVFPSAGEECMWRISSVVIVAYPTSFFFIWFIQSLLRRLLKKKNVWGLQGGMVGGVIIFGVFFSVYIMARLFILLEAFLSLRILPDSATYTVRWTTFLPHI